MIRKWCWMINYDAALCDSILYTAVVHLDTHLKKSSNTIYFDNFEGMLKLKNLKDAKMPFLFITV